MNKMFYALPFLLLAMSACNDDDDTSKEDLRPPRPAYGQTGSEDEKKTEEIKDQDEKVYDYRKEPTVWLSGDYRFDIFPQAKDTILILSDGLNIIRYFSVTDKATLEWCADTRQIGRTYKFSFDNKILKLDDVSYVCGPLKETIPSKFDSESFSIKSEYFMNMAGKYEASDGYEISVEAKLGVSKSVSQYWNANIVDLECDEDGVYTCLLAHSSSPDGAGSIDPGITGNEPFISKQGNFWSWCQFVPSPGSQWTLRWSSEWANSPYEALQNELDCKATFTGPATTKLKYTFTFHYGNPSKDEKGWCTVDKGEKLCEDYVVESDVPRTFHLSDFKDFDYKYNESLVSGYWWYSTNSITSIEDSYVYKISETTDLFLEHYDIYLSNQERVVSAGSPLPEAVLGKFVRAVDPKTELIVSANKITYDGVEYSVIDYKLWQPGEKSNGYAVLVSDGSKMYALYLMHYFTVDEPYIKFRTPKVFEKEELPESYENSDNSYNWDLLNGWDKKYYYLQK